MRIKSFLLIGIAALALAGCAGGEVSATASPGGANTPMATSTP